MLCDNLYTLLSLETTQQGCLAQIRLLPESPIYAAHFKGMPVTPGACCIVLLFMQAALRAGLDVPSMWRKLRTSVSCIPSFPARRPN